jgi:hypothetical protein
MGRACSTVGVKSVVRKPEAKKPLGRPTRRWVVNVIVDLGGRSWVC